MKSGDSLIRFNFIQLMIFNLILFVMTNKQIVLFFCKLLYMPDGNESTHFIGTFTKMDQL